MRRDGAGHVLARPRRQETRRKRATSTCRYSRWKDRIEWEKKTYLVRRLRCLASALLSTSGGILFATVSCECTRKASAPGVLGTSRLPVAGCAGDE
jgi:hypothetical protein